MLQSFAGADKFLFQSSYIRPSTQTKTEDDMASLKEKQATIFYVLEHKSV